MKLGKVIGNIVATVKDPGLERLRLLVVQGLDDDYQPIGNPFVAADGILTAGPGDIVYLVSKKEAAIAISKDKLIPIDECIVGYVDEYEVIKTAKEDRKVPEIKPKIKYPDEELLEPEKTIEEKKPS
ncbi:MAG: EutN/CcmL family microcompartment protein [Candidatus Hodarchaeales archaeon]|jgi:ethanolamine utilization protein EutN